MIQNRIRRKFKCRNLGCLYESVSFNKILSHTWDKHSLAQNFSFKCEISSCTNRYTNLQSFRRHVKSKHCWFFEQYVKYFNTQQAAADETDLFVNNADIQEVDDLQEDDFFDLIANLLLEFREKYNVSVLLYN